MNTLFLDQFGEHHSVDLNCIPPIGTQIGLFNRIPSPTVKEIVLFPDHKIFDKAGIIYHQCLIVVQ